MSFEKEKKPMANDNKQLTVFELLQDKSDSIINFNKEQRAEILRTLVSFQRAFEPFRGLSMILDGVNGLQQQLNVQAQLISSLQQQVPARLKVPADEKKTDAAAT